jgi:hypothetical protein
VLTHELRQACSRLSFDDGRIIAVPFDQSKDLLFLKTAFPSRKMTKLYKEDQK